MFILKSVLGGSGTETASSGADTVEKLVDRIKESPSLSDRRDACRTLRALSKRFRLEVGAQAMECLLGVLEKDRPDQETSLIILEALINITNPEYHDEEDVADASVSCALGEQFSEIFLKKADNAIALLSFLDEPSPQIKYVVLKLLINLAKNKVKPLQEFVLESRSGISKLMDTLKDPFEYIRNEGLLLLMHLTKSNANLQKIVAFENAFDRLYDVMNQEGFVDGGVITEDCLQLTLNLLKNNPSNQTFFREGSVIQKYHRLLSTSLESGSLAWSEQRGKNTILLLKVMRVLVSPSNPAQLVISCQKILRACGMIATLGQLLLANGVPANVLTETILTTGDAIRGLNDNQLAFALVSVNTFRTKSVIVLMLLTMMTDRQAMPLRLAVLYVIQSYLYKNNQARETIIETLLPASAEATPELSSGHALCIGLFNSDPLCSWLAAITLSHVLQEDEDGCKAEDALNRISLKEKLVQVQLATGISNEPVSLLQQCTTVLLQGNELQARIGILILLSTWLSGCPQAVNAFLKLDGAMAFLTSQISSTENEDNDGLLQGMCAFLLGVCLLYTDGSVENYDKVSLIQLVSKRIGTDFYLERLSRVQRNEIYVSAAKHPEPSADHQSQLLFDYEFCKLFRLTEGAINHTLLAKPGTQHAANGSPGGDITLVSKYKELIRQQDAELQELRTRLGQIEALNATLQEQLHEKTYQIDQLRSSYAPSEASNLGTSLQNLSIKTPLGNSGAASIQQMAEHPVQNGVSTKVEIEQNSYRNYGPAYEFSQNYDYYSMAMQLSQQLQQSLADNTLLQAELSSVKNHLDSVLSERVSAECELDTFRKDQEDLLLLLTDQEAKLSAYRKRLRELGDEVPDEDNAVDDYDEDGGAACD